MEKKCIQGEWFSDDIRIDFKKNKGQKMKYLDPAQLELRSGE